MIKVKVKKGSNYPVSTPKIKQKLQSFFKREGIVSDAVVFVSIIGKDKMYELAKNYLGENKVLHNVLSFPEKETRGNFAYPPDSPLFLGEIIVCYPKAFEEAQTESKRIDEKLEELVEHGALHLMGKNHE